MKTFSHLKKLGKNGITWPWLYVCKKPKMFGLQGLFEPTSGKDQWCMYVFSLTHVTKTIRRLSIAKVSKSLLKEILVQTVYYYIHNWSLQSFSQDYGRAYILLALNIRSLINLDNRVFFQTDCSGSKAYLPLLSLPFS